MNQPGLVSGVNGDGDERVRAVPVSISAVGGCQRGWCGSCKAMRALAGKLRAAGLNVTAIPYPHSGAGDAEVIQELEIDNPAAPERGTFRITDSGEVMWEYHGHLDSEQ